MKIKLFTLIPLGLFLLGASVAEGSVQAEDDAYDVSGLFAAENDQEAMDVDQKNKKKGEKIKKTAEEKAAEKAEKRKLKEEKKAGKQKGKEEEITVDEDESEEAAAPEKLSKRTRVKNWFNRKFHRNKNAENTDEVKSDKEVKKAEQAKSKKDKEGKAKSSNKKADADKKPGLMSRFRDKFRRNKTSNKK